MRWLAKRRGDPLKGQRGFSFLETVVAVGILGFMGAAFMVALNTGNEGIGDVNEQIRADALARSQLDEIRNAPYTDGGEYPESVASPVTGVYLVTVDVPSEYSLTITVQTIDERAGPLDCADQGNCNTFQEITVSVFSSGGGDRPILTLKSYIADK